MCANCHGTLEQPGSLPTAPRFATGAFKAGGDPYAIYHTLTFGSGMMLPQGWMVPSQKYDVIHYLRETFLKDKNRAWYTPITPDYLASLPAGTSRGPEPSAIEPWRLHDYGPFLAGTFEGGKGEGTLPARGLPSGSMMDQAVLAGATPGPSMNSTPCDWLLSGRAMPSWIGLESTSMVSMGRIREWQATCT